MQQVTPNLDTVVILLTRLYGMVYIRSVTLPYLFTSLCYIGLLKDHIV